VIIPFQGASNHIASGGFNRRDDQVDQVDLVLNRQTVHFEHSEKSKRR
jgi:hypothetical protein